MNLLLRAIAWSCSVGQMSGILSSRRMWSSILAATALMPLRIVSADFWSASWLGSSSFWTSARISSRRSARASIFGFAYSAALLSVMPARIDW